MTKIHKNGPVTVCKLEDGTAVLNIDGGEGFTPVRFGLTPKAQYALWGALTRSLQPVEAVNPKVTAVTAERLHPWVQYTQTKEEK